MHGRKTNRQRRSSAASLLLLGLIMILCLSWLWQMDTKAPELTYSQVRQLFEQEKVESFSFADQHTLVLHLREKVDGVNRREKFRLRYYGKDTSFLRLEKKFKIRRSTIAEILKGMEKKGLIVRTFSPLDKRTKKIELTKKAIAMCEEEKERVKETERKLTDGLSEDDIKTFYTLMDKMLGNLQKEELK